jgi:2'-5' RNA ligase
VYSLNVPVPGEVRRVASDLHPRLTAFDAVRERHSLLVKRLGDGSLPRVRERLREPLSGSPAFEVRLSGIDYFERPVNGTGPVVYLAVESPGLYDLHDRLVSAFGAVAELEGDEYVPHVTLARGGSVADAERLAAVDVPPVTWTVSRLALWDDAYRETVARFELPR